MSDTQTVWMVIWNRATKGPGRREPFEVSEIVPDVAKALSVSEHDAARLIRGLLKELERLPEGKQYFALEGDAIVPLPEFAEVPADPRSALAAYPFEL